MLDYSGNMEYFQEQLRRAGITKEMVNMDKYAGLTHCELQSVVNFAIARKEQQDMNRKGECDKY